MVVLGTHRSGTSALAGALSLLGVRFGDRLLPAQEGVNSKGFWEHSEVVMLHEELLAALGFSWDDVRSLPERWWQGAEARYCRVRLAETLQQDFTDAQLWGVKDPRICRLLPMWMDIFAEIKSAPFFVLIFRHPLEVAASLGKRDGICSEKSALLYLSHLLEAELWSRGSPRLFVSYDQLLAEPLMVMEKISICFGLDWIQKIKKKELQLREFLGVDSRHYVSSGLGDVNSGDWVNMEAQKAYDAFLLLEQKDVVRGGNALEDVRKSLAARQNILGVIGTNHIATQQARLRALQSQLSDTERNANAQIIYRDQLIAEWEVRLKAVEENANAQIIYRDQLIAAWEARLKAVEENANAQIIYRDQLIAGRNELIANLEKEFRIWSPILSKLQRLKKTFLYCVNKLWH